MIRRAFLALMLLTTSVGEPVSTTRAYLDTALDLLQRHSIDSTNGDWPALRGEAHRVAAHADRPSDTYPAIEQVITALGNPHTSLVTSPSGGAPPLVRTVPTGRLVGTTAWLTLLPTSFQNGETYVTAGRDLVRDLIAEQPSGWVVDLRGNTGGAMHPMLAVVAPLLGEGRTGAFVHPGGVTVDWGIRDGHVYSGERISFPRLDVPQQTNRPVAVLTDGQTASSGEAVLISFLGAANSRSFGAPTAGYATSNEVFELPDGALLAITTAHMADRTGRTYGNAPINPDVPVDSADALDAAIAWLSEQH